MTIRVPHPIATAIFVLLIVATPPFEGWLETRLGPPSIAVAIALLMAAVIGQVTISFTNERASKDPEKHGPPYRKYEALVWTAAVAVVLGASHALGKWNFHR